MKPGAWLINISHGEVMGESTLLEVFENGHLEGAALDVMTKELSSNSNWVKDDPLVFFPTKESCIRIMFALAKLLDDDWKHKPIKKF